MKIPAGINKWGVAVLGAVCLLLVVNLVGEYRSTQAPKSRAVVRPGSSRAPADKASSHAADDLAKYDPSIHFDQLQEMDSRPLPDEDRNPFEGVGGAAPPAPSRSVVNTTNVAPAPPPPPPPPPLKAVGYNELPGGQKEAMLTFNEDVVVVHEGDVVGTKYRVVKIEPSKVVVIDGDTQKNIELPFPQ